MSVLARIIFILPVDALEVHVTTTDSVKPILSLHKQNTICASAGKITPHCCDEAVSH